MASPGFTVELHTLLPSDFELLSRDRANAHQKTGQDAMDSTEPTKQAVVKAFQDQLDSLSNPIQKQMFQPVMNQYLLNMGRDIANHDLAQQRTYAIGQAQQSAASYAQLALNASDSHGQVDADGNATGDFAKYSSLMHQNVLQSGALRQLNPDSGEAQGDLRAQWSALNSAVILKKLDQGDAQGAQRVFDAAVANDRLHPQDVSMLGDTITDAASRQAVQDGVARYAALAISNADSNANGNDDTGNQHNTYGGGGDDSAADVRDDAETEGGGEGEAPAGSQNKKSGTAQPQTPAPNGKVQEQKRPQTPEERLTALTNIIYNETSSFSTNPSTKSGDQGSAEDLHNGRLAVGEVAHKLLTGKHPERVLVKTELKKSEADAIKQGYGPAVTAYNDARAAAAQILAGSATVNGATQYRTRFSNDVSTNVGHDGHKKIAGTSVSQHFGPFTSSTGHSGIGVIVIAP